MKKLLAILLLLASSVHAEEFSEWDATDKRLLWAGQALIAADWAQTRQIAKNPDQYSEKNRYLGEHPSVGKVNTYFVSALAAHYYTAAYLSGSDRTAMLTGIVAVEAYVVNRNAKLGLKIAF
jgi:hypothetical protein